MLAEDGYDNFATVHFERRNDERLMGNFSEEFFE